MRIICGKHTEKGKRQENQDAVTAYAEGRLPFFAVADGAGGLKCGRQASQMVIKAVLNEFSDTADMPLEPLMMHITDKYRQMNEYLNIYQNENSVQMATTLAMLHLSGSSYIISNVGDTQVFLIRKNTIQLISQVHNLAWLSYLNGDIAFEDIRKHEGSHVLTRALGGHDGVRPYIASGALKPGDVFILCTDGVYNHIDKQNMIDFIELSHPSTHAQMDALCAELVNLALNNGSSDNCSVVSVKIFKGVNSHERQADLNHTVQAGDNNP